jgi:hypothetical protein
MDLFTGSEAGRDDAGSGVQCGAVRGVRSLANRL